MSRAELEKWEQKYRAGEYTPNDEPSALLAEWLRRLPLGRALDVACGLGRNALFLAEHGFSVDAIDISAAGLAIARKKALGKGLTVNWIRADLDNFALPAQAYNLIVDNFYLNRGLALAFVAALKPGGVLLFEHHLVAEGNGDGPRRGTMRRAPTNAEFKLKPGELKSLFRELHALDYFEGPVPKDGELVPLAQLVARKNPGRG